jgi:UDP-N-acetylglucosamine 1-carboxyvinyltransferase
MASMVIAGGRPLHGVVDVGGSKNGALPVLAGSLLVPGETIVENVPDIEDVATMIDMLRALGVKVAPVGAGTLRIDATHIASTSAPHEIVRKMRASFYVAGPLLARCGEATVPVPGGCVLGPRPVNFHVEGFNALGAQVTEQHGVVHAKARRLRGARVFLDPRFRSVGATHNIMMAAVMAEGTTIIENASREPETVDCARFLNKCGARIAGSGSATIVIDGVKELRGCRHRVIPDRMEAGTFLIAGAATRGDVTVRGVDLTHLEVQLRTLRQAGAQLVTNGHSVRVIGEGRPKAFDTTTGPYPGFPTDMQPCTVALMALADGTSHMHETIFDARFGYTDELLRMGARIRVVDQLAIVRGVEHLWGAPVEASDIRAGAGIVVAALAAQGHTEISGAEFLDRGYENLVEKLAVLGAEVSRPGRRKLCWA